LPLDTPEDWNDFDTIRWFLIHGGTTVFTEEDIWYLMVFSTCKHLREDNLCGIYEPGEDLPRLQHQELRVRRRLVYDRYIEVPEQWRNMPKHCSAPQGKNIRSPKPEKSTLVY